MGVRAKLLICEDDAALRRVLELRLTLEGFDVTTAADGQEGLALLPAVRPDVAITDLMMPNLDGFGFCRGSRLVDGFAELPIILLTAHSRDPDVDDLLELGGIVFMPKPFDAPTLTGTLHEMLAARAEAQAAG